jgi:hypothetical protein
MAYSDAFPTFSPSSLPAIPSTWEDTSWGNDPCPSWCTPSGLTVLVDFEEPSMREFPEEGPRFHVIDPTGRDVVDVYDGDDWEEVLRWVGLWRTSN